MFRRTKLPLDEFSAGRNGNYIWRDLWTGPSICNRSVTGSLPFASSHRLVRCCLWLADLPIRLIGSAEVTLNPPADIDISVVPDVLPTTISVKTVVSDKSMKIDTLDAVVSSMTVAGGSPPAEVNISRGPDALQTAVFVTTGMLVNINTPDTVESGIEITGGGPPAVSDISVNTDVLQTARYVTTQMSEKWMMIHSPDTVDSGMEMASGSPLADFDISVGPEVLLTAMSVTTVLSEKWMNRFVMDLDVLCSDGVASCDDPA